MMRFAGDHVAERWSTADFLGLLIQIGAFPQAAPYVLRLRGLG